MPCPEYKWSPDGPECDTCGEVHQPDPKTTWTTADKQVLQVEDMTDSHLVNAIRFIRRKWTVDACRHHIAARVRFLHRLGDCGSVDVTDWFPNPFDDEIADLSDLSNAGEHEAMLHWVVPPYRAMLAQAEKRGLRA